MYSNNESMTDVFYITLQLVLWLKSAQHQKLSENRSCLLGGYVIVVLTGGVL